MSLGRVPSMKGMTITSRNKGSRNRKSNELIAQNSTNSARSTKFHKQSKEQERGNEQSEECRGEENEIETHKF